MASGLGRLRVLLIVAEEMLGFALRKGIIHS